MTLKKILSLSTVVAAMFVAAQASATIVTLDPAANNGGAGTLSATNAAFPTDKGTTNFASLLDIASLPGASGPIGFSETGFLDVNEWSITANTVSGVHINYFVYATFTISGTGEWVANNFIANTSGLSVAATVVGSPGSNTSSGLTYCDPTVGTFGICTKGSNDFTLGTANLNTAISASATLASGGLASESFDALLNFSPAAGTTGAGGFWESPIPFSMILNTSATGNAGSPGTTYSTTATDTLVLTSVTSGDKPIGAGSGNVIFNQVPEPSTIALLGIALLAVGGLARRSGRDQA